MKNNTKLIMETWRRFMKEGPQDGEFDINEPFDFSGDYSDGELPQENEPPFDSHEPPTDDFDRETQGPNSYVPDTGIVNAIVSKLKVEPHLTDEDIMEEVPEAYPEDIDKARRSFKAGEEDEYPGENDQPKLDSEMDPDELAALEARREEDLSRESEYDHYDSEEARAYYVDKDYDY